MLRADVARHVFRGRACVVISMAPRSWSAVDELPGRTEVRIRTQRFPVFVLAADAASDELLCFVGRSEDFERGYCWIVTAGSGQIDPDRPLLEWLVGGMATPEPFPDLEVLSMDADGEEISWTAPGDAKPRAAQLNLWLPGDPASTS